MTAEPDRALWWPPVLGDIGPAGLHLLQAGGAEGSPSSVEPWPRIEADGRLRRAAQSKPVSPAAVSSAPLSPIGFALANGSSRLNGVREQTIDGRATWQRVVPIEDDLLDAALAAEWQPYAWTRWADWRGEPELLFHVSRTMCVALEDCCGKAVTPTITVWTSDVDFERFDDPHALRSDLTTYAAGHMQSVEVHADSDGITGRFRGNPGPADDPKVSRRALLEMTAISAGDINAVGALHDRVRAAVSRGEPRFFPSSPGVVTFRPRPDVPTPSPLAREPDAVYDGWLNRLFVYGVVQAVLFFFSSTTLVISPWIPAAFAMIVTWVFCWSWFVGGVALGASHRAVRLRELAERAALLVIGPAAGYGIKALLSALE